MSITLCFFSISSSNILKLSRRCISIKQTAFELSVFEEDYLYFFPHAFFKSSRDSFLHFFLRFIAPKIQLLLQRFFSRFLHYFFQIFSGVYVKVPLLRFLHSFLPRLFYESFLDSFIDPSQGFLQDSSIKDSSLNSFWNMLAIVSGIPSLIPPWSSLGIAPGFPTRIPFRISSEIFLEISSLIFPGFFWTLLPRFNQGFFKEFLNLFLHCFLLGFFLTFFRYSSKYSL